MFSWIKRKLLSLEPLIERGRVVTTIAGGVLIVGSAASYPLPESISFLVCGATFALLLSVMFCMDLAEAYYGMPVDRPSEKNWRAVVNRLDSNAGILGLLLFGAIFAQPVRELSAKAPGWGWFGLPLFEWWAISLCLFTTAWLAFEVILRVSKKLIPD